MDNFMSSAAKIAANLANAKKSTGPKSEEGKAKVSQNGRKHGLSGTKFYCPEHSAPSSPRWNRNTASPSARSASSKRTR